MWRNDPMELHHDTFAFGNRKEREPLILLAKHGAGRVVAKCPVVSDLAFPSRRRSQNRGSVRFLRRALFPEGTGLFIADLQTTLLISNSRDC